MTSARVTFQSEPSGDTSKTSPNCNHGERDLVPPLNDWWGLSKQGQKKVFPTTVSGRFMEQIVFEITSTPKTKLKPQKFLNFFFALLTFYLFGSSFTSVAKCFTPR